MESKLIEKSIAGDVKSFEQLIQSYNRYVYNIAYRMMGNEEDAKDMSQEALIKAYKAMPGFKMESQFSTWLYRIVINTCKDELRKRKEHILSLDEEIAERITLEQTLESNSGDPLMIYEKKEMKNALDDALNKLSDEGRSVVVLKDLLGYTYEEIGEILQIPIGTVRSRLNRSRSTLRMLLKVQLAE
ncbi:RNA polymerase sigma factor [Fusibacter tunisiensis]|uniref:RNA polymerase sigma-70 factor (ECF subfamily) n=1 Tax=Fusibacter tunisiensis TaxID=1008308 RepID=A0ABS2MN13_9FIRM|nr:sigma-70 family RNA polymerase sigma factor [Fusibacter tunisiensis]MBM7560779.1 RNA polymerase sigma-70 factor (ECF subfamily) [Fusibacter tunisiensis]